jgi:uncharacterized protein with HEPN domain
MSVAEDQIRIRHMVDAAHKIIAFTHDETRASLDNDEKLALALIRLIEIIGEAASRLTDEFKDQHSSIPWAAIIGMRNRLIHAYFNVDLDRVWDTVQISVPTLLAQIEPLLDPDHP